MLLLYGDVTFYVFQTKLEECKRKGMDVNLEVICNGLLALQG